MNITNRASVIVVCRCKNIICGLRDVIRLLGRFGDGRRVLTRQVGGGRRVVPVHVVYIII